MELLIYIVCMYGLTNLLVYGNGPFNIISKFRNYVQRNFPSIGEMFDCMMCTSTNIGWVLSLINILFLQELALTPFMYMFNCMTNYWYFIIPLDACFTSGAVWLLHSFQEMCESISNNFNNKDINNE